MSHERETTTHDSSPHPASLQHHFDTPRQQLEAAVQGMWLFLATEILLFGGLFCLYAVFRANHPEIFEYAHQYLSKFWGATNTVILLCSSFTMATAVWAAQVGRRKTLLTMLALTILCGCGFLGIKYIEYQNKWKEGLLWGVHFRPEHAAEPFAQHSAEEHAATLSGSHAASAPAPAASQPQLLTSAPATAPATSQASPDTQATQPDPSWVFRSPGSGPRGLRPPSAAPALLAPEQRVRNVQTFFAVYFAMTGLHGLHVLAGLAVITWILVRSARGDFSPAYHTPVHMTGLYWHVVDLIWIYLFPLLYLIH
jgi:cytochrome c oxidase subunit 3